MAAVLGSQEGREAPGRVVAHASLPRRARRARPRVHALCHDEGIAGHRGEPDVMNEKPLLVPESKTAAALEGDVALDLARAPRAGLRRDALHRREPQVGERAARLGVLVEGLRVARSLARPLCLDLRDPWTLNFFQQGRARWAAALGAWEVEVQALALAPVAGDGAMLRVGVSVSWGQ